MQVPGANNSKFGVLVSKQEKYLDGKDYDGDNIMQQIVIHGDNNKFDRSFTASGINKNTKNRHSIKGNVKI